MIKILLAFAGITGIGKSYYKDKVCEKLGFEKIRIITTRAPRKKEVNNEDKIFVSKEELEKMEEEGEIAYSFDMLGNTYAYTNDALFSKKDTVFEMHYTTVADFKRICPHIKTIYLLPKDLDATKNKLLQRGLEPAVEQARLREIDEHYNRITTDKKLMDMFDVCVYNNYDKESEDEIIYLVKKMMNAERNGK